MTETQKEIIHQGISINCDMGESFGLYRMGNDEAIMPYITHANIACGFHGSDPNHMATTVRLAKAYGVQVGAHFSYPDLPGFGRREMKIQREELKNLIVYQVGALKGFLKEQGVRLSHLKPHGALYGVSAREQDTALAVADVAKVFDVPVFGLSGTLHEEVFRAAGVTFIPEFFADLDYDDDGRLVITREHGEVDPDHAAERCARAVGERLVTSLGGRDVPVVADTVCVHSDTPNAVEVAAAVHARLFGMGGAASTGSSFRQRV